VEELAADRVEDDAEGRVTIDDERDADREEWDAVGVVDRAVERVPAATPPETPDSSARKRSPG
jgi:hypothetical protein